MWNAIQGVANKASKLAVEVLDPGTHENSNSGTRQTSSTTGTFTTDRLSALKARYKASESEGVAPVSEADSNEPSTRDTRLGTGILIESTEVTKLRSQLEKLKEEMMRQNTISDDQLKQQNYQFNEQIKQKEIQHKMELDHSREEITQYFQNLMKAKDQELAQLRNGGEGGDEKGLELETRLQELNSENVRLRTEVAELQQNGINAAFGLDSTLPTVDSTKLQEDYNKLQEDYKNLQESTSTLIPSEALTERDAFWQRELERVRSEGQGVKEEEVRSLQESFEQECKAKEEALKQRSKLEEEINRLEHSLQERDSIWQQELISNQNSQLEIKKHYEAIKVELNEIKDQKQELKNSLKKLETSKKNEMELRSAAESHVKSLQKNMQEMGSDASNFKHQLTDSMNQLTQMQDQYEAQIQSMKQDFQQRLIEQQTSHQHLTQVNQELTSRLESMENEHQRCLTELKSVKTRYLANGEELDISKMSYDLESASENLKLAQTKNSLLSHEVESLTKELEDLRTTQNSSSEIIKESSEDPEIIQKLQNERDGFKEQLKRLKQQLIQMEEDSEASILWRIDAEVKLALEAYKQQESFPNKLQLESALEQAQKLNEEYRIQSESKTQEISNLQVALGELTYHGEAADKLRRDLRLAQEQIRQLEDQLIDAKASIAESNSARRAAEVTADEAHRKIANSKDKIASLETSLFSSKKELLDLSQKLQKMGNDASSMVDRRLVVQLLVAYLEKRHSQDALEVMARMLSFTEEEKNRIGVKSKGRGFFGSVAGGTLALVKGGMSVATLGLLDRGLNSETGSQFADEWVDFLTKEEDLKTPQEQDPLAYLQQGLDSPKRRPLSYFDEQPRTHSPYQNYHRTTHSPSLSSKSEIGTASANAGGLGVDNRVQNWRPSGTGATTSSIQPFSGSIPSFKDYIEKQNAS